jgi:uncharacterized protein with NAD-binding domain and iron-sulfur cluster
VLYGKPAQTCTSDEIVREVWQQLKSHVKDAGLAITDDLLLSSSIDPGLVRGPNGLRNEDPLVLPSIGARKHRPTSSTAVANLMLAGDYPLGHWEVGNMEAANSSGRAAANAVLQRSGSNEPLVRVFGPYRPPEWEPLKRIDAERYKHGRGNLFDISAPDHPLDAVRQLLQQLVPDLSPR